MEAKKCEKCSTDTKTVYHYGKCPKENELSKAPYVHENWCPVEPFDPSFFRDEDRRK